MSRLKETAFRIARAGPLPMPSNDRLLQIEKVAARLALMSGAGEDAGPPKPQLR